jgi:hypothetical protein
MESINKMRLSVIVLCVLAMYAGGVCINQCEKADYAAACVILNCLIDCGSDRLFNAVTSIDIRIYNSTILCKATYPTLDYRINLQSSSISLHNSTLISSTITLTASESIIIDENSCINTTAQGLSAQVRGYDWGGSYGGRGGGLCYSKTVKAYTNGDIYNPNLKGEGGYRASLRNNIVSRGGGIISITSNILYLDGNLLSDGESCDLQPKPGYDAICQTQYSNGGSGGSVLIKVNYLDIGLDPIISASGGYSANLGGGGGRIAIYSSNTVNLDVRAYGGYGRKAEIPCNGGGPGTVYLNSSETATLRIENSFRSSSITPVMLNDENLEVFVIKTVIVPESSKMLAKVLVFREGNLDTSVIAGDSYDLEVKSEIVQILQYSNVGMSKIIITDSVSNFQSINFIVSNLYLDSSSDIFQSFTLNIQGDSTRNDTKVHLAGTIDRRYEDQGDIFIFANYFKLELEGFITCKHLSIYADSIDILGTIQSTVSSCKKSKDFNESNQYRCIPKESSSITSLATIDSLTDIYTTQSFTIYIQASNYLHSINGSKIRGGRVGLCSKKLEISGLISASGSGCLPNKGEGAGSFSGKCAGSGAAHGGNGGQGHCETQELEIYHEEHPGGLKYDQEGLPLFEGSGGGAAEGGAAGSGGGYIQIESHYMNVTGNVITNASAASKVGNVGVGGGSGGSIIVRTRYLEGSGLFNASGSEGINGGGNGAGGVIYLDWIGEEETPSKILYGCSAAWYGNIDVRSPENFKFKVNKAEPGAKKAQACSEGYGEIYCKPCGKGYYKDEEGYQTCSKCDNKPTDAIYVDDVATSSDCDYECPKSYTSEVDNPDCNSQTYEFLHVYGSPYAILGIIIGLWLVLFLMNQFYIKRYYTSISRNLRFSYESIDPTIKLEGFSRKSPNLKSSNPDLVAKDMGFHGYRIFLLGNNTYYSPWSLARTPPIELNTEIYQDEYSIFVDNLNKELVWRWWENLISLLLSITMPDFSILWSYYRRRDKYMKLRNFISQCSEDFWIKIELRQMSNSLRISASKCYTTACIEILDHEKKQRNMIPLKCPVWIMAKGDGSIMFPYSLQEDDVFLNHFKMSLEFEYQEVFEIFMKEINSALRLVNLKEAVPNKSEDCFIQINEICNVYNLMLGKDHNLHISPVIFQASVNKSTLKSRMSYLLDIFTSKSSSIYDYRPGLVITNIDSSSRMLRYLDNDYWEINTLNTEDKEFLITSGVYVADNPYDARDKFWYPLSSVLILKPKFNLMVVSLCLTLLLSLETVWYM